MSSIKRFSRSIEVINSKSIVSFIAPDGAKLQNQDEIKKYLTASGRGCHITVVSYESYDMTHIMALQWGHIAYLRHL